ncbi:unnamed protein product, partial [Allacma fusca]
MIIIIKQLLSSFLWKAVVLGHSFTIQHSILKGHVEERYDRQMSMLNSATCYSEAVGQVKSIPSTDYITISKRYPAKQAWH